MESFAYKVTSDNDTATTVNTMGGRAGKIIIIKAGGKYGRKRIF